MLEKIRSTYQNVELERNIIDKELITKYKIEQFDEFDFIRFNLIHKIKTELSGYLYSILPICKNVINNILVNYLFE